MDICQRGETIETICQHPLPCPFHGTRTDPVTIRVDGWDWLIEPLEDGVLVSLLREGRVTETRWCAIDDGACGIERLQSWMLVNAGLKIPVAA